MNTNDKINITVNNIRYLNNSPVRGNIGIGLNQIRNMRKYDRNFNETPVKAHMAGGGLFGYR